MALFDERGRQLRGWINKLIWGDNKLVLSSLKNGPLREEIEAQGGLKLIYIDPPFDVGADFSMDIEVGSDTLTKKPNILEEIAYRDTWGKGADSFIAMIYERLVLMRDLLAEDGSIYVHIGWDIAVYIIALMNEIFGIGCLQNIIVYNYGKFRHSKDRWKRDFDLLLYYSKNPSVWTFNHDEVLDEYQEKTEVRFDKVDEEGKRYKILKGRRVYYQGGVTPSSVWRLSNLQNNAVEYLGYPTQKTEELLTKVVQSSSNPGDLIADFFCGSGTPAAVAEKLGRKWICTDLGKFAVHTTRKRMIGVQRQLKADGKNYRAFEILNLGKYERQHFIGIPPSPPYQGGKPEGRGDQAARPEREEIRRRILERKETEFLGLILRAYRAEKVENFTAFHGKKAGRLVAVGPVNLPVTRLFVEEIILECRRNHITKVDILGFEFEMGLFPNVLDEARGKGIDIAPKYIPAEVFDKRAVERNQVVFHDVSFIEVKPHIIAGREGQPATVAVELTDFSVFYSQDSIAQAEEALGKKQSGSKVVVEKGQIVKLTKDKQGVFQRERLTNHWTDWIDYWSVDFDFESKREIIRVKKKLSPDEQSAFEGMSDAQQKLLGWEEQWTGDFILENEWQSFRTKKDRSLELKSVAHECQPGRHKIAVKVVDIFGNDTMTIVEVSV